MSTSSREAAADALADAVSKLGSCKAHDRERPEHANHCAKCKAKRAMEEYLKAKDTTAQPGATP